jgi:hypothetical protein
VLSSQVTPSIVLASSAFSERSPSDGPNACIVRSHALPSSFVDFCSGVMALSASP